MGLRKITLTDGRVISGHESNFTEKEGHIVYTVGSNTERIYPRNIKEDIEGSRVSNGDGCFVATVVYGDPQTPEVRALRRFRDETLQQSPVGRAFVDFYYSGVGQLVADFIKTQLPSSIPIIRRGLDVIAKRYQK